MKKLNLWMLTAILTICGTMAFTSCLDEEVDSVAERTQKQLTGVWYAECKAAGVSKNSDGSADDYYSTIERYDFKDDGTGRWSLYYMGDQVFPIATIGGIVDGDFTYCVENDGTVNIHFEAPANFPAERSVTFANGKLVASMTDGTKKSFVTPETTLAKAFNEWDDYDHMASDELQDGNRIYGVGYGYNFILDHSIALSRAPIMDQTVIKENNLRMTSGIDADIHEATYTGHSLTEVANDFSANAKVSGGTFGFKGEVGAAFDAKYKKNSEFEYALTIIDVSLTNVSLEADLDFVKNHLAPTFKLAIEGKTNTYKGKKGLYNLVRDYGTHFVCQTKLGGRVRYANTVDISKVSGVYDLSAYAKASYKGIGISASGSVSEQYKKSFEENKSAVDTRITAIGGTAETVLALTEKGDESSFKEWRETLAKDNYKNTCVVSIGQVYPIWDLVNDDPERAKEIENYIKDGGFERDMFGENDFLVGAIGKISNVTELFTKEDDTNGTLVKYLDIDGNIVAQACKEFIPQLNTKQRSIVLYPVVNNKPKYNLGYFIGNSSMAPCRVCWSTTSSVPTLIGIPREEKNIGAKNELYVLGCSFLHKDIDNETIKNGQVRPVTSSGFYMTSRGLTSKGDVENKHKYPLIKIFNHVWTRENFSAPMDKGFKKGNDNQAFYNHELISVESNRNRLPNGWILPTEVMYKTLQDELKNRNIQSPADEMGIGGVVGFNAPWIGWMLNNTLNEKDKSAHFWAYQWNEKDKKPNYNTHYYFKLDNETGNISLTESPSKDTDHFYSVRLVQDITW